MRYIFLLLLFSFSLTVGAQERRTETKPLPTRDSVPDYKSYPYWITMMDDTAANYFEVSKAFYTYWEGKGKPVLESNEAHDIFNEEGEEEETTPSEYTYEYKRFKFWERYYKDLHDENGIIFSPERIIEEWRKKMEAERKN